MNHTMFFTAIMERDDEIICVASLRVHENKVAEMPLITTRGMYRRQGMCTRFMTVIESVLSSLGVDLLVIPSVKEREKTWVSVFGFEPFDLETKTRTEKMKIFVCSDSVMLKKNIKSVVREVPNTERNQF
ncbi:increased DNA methylation 1-like [Arachis duranensis]|uniref:Increased DNA methylation 1-like n=1 Tax=Arachis duranensis TaxID=130453 RepID=A0A9C6WK23_ARADU|nr:increased DNA methylation 1-like [Arachis duranensis]